MILMSFESLLILMFTVNIYNDVIQTDIMLIYNDIITTDII